MTKNIDMLHGPLMKKIFWFALPIAGSSILQQLFSAADVAVAGRFAESGALAAVGSNSVLVSFYINLFAGLSVGVNVVVSHFLGQQKRKEVGTVIHTAVLFSLFCGLILMAAVCFFQAAADRHWHAGGCAGAGDPVFSDLLSGGAVYFAV